MLNVIHFLTISLLLLFSSSLICFDNVFIPSLNKDATLLDSPPKIYTKSTIFSLLWVFLLKAAQILECHLPLIVLLQRTRQYFHPHTLSSFGHKQIILVGTSLQLVTRIHIHIITCSNIPNPVSHLPLRDRSVITTRTFKSATLNSQINLLESTHLLVPSPDFVYRSFVIFWKNVKETNGNYCYPFYSSFNAIL